MAGPIKGLHIAIAAFVISVILAVASIGAFLYLNASKVHQNTEQVEEVRKLAHEVKHLNEKLQAGLIKGCRKNNESVRRTLRSVLEDQIAQSKSANLSKFFPQIPPAELQRLIAQQNAKRRIRIKSLHPLNCHTQYSDPHREEKR